MDQADGIELSELVPEDKGIKSEVPVTLPPNALLQQIATAVVSNSTSTSAPMKRKNTRGVFNGKFIKKKRCPPERRMAGTCDSNIHFYRTKNGMSMFTNKKGKKLKTLNPNMK